MSSRVVIGSIIIKHLCNLDDCETVAQKSENIYIQYLLGYTSFTNEKPIDASLLTDFRKWLRRAKVNAINERIVSLKASFDSQKQPGQIGRAG
jgi:transposase, IS5 family